MSRAVLHCGDVRTVLATLPAESVQCVVTSPPYWGLRDYGVQGQLGLEGTPGEYVEAMVSVFREVRRVLRPDGVCWLNLGDSYASSNATLGRHDQDRNRRNVRSGQAGRPDTQGSVGAPTQGAIDRSAGLKPKDLVGIPWRVAFALQADGWWLRSDVIWSKNNPMPESVTDRPTRSHEYLFLLTKAERYFYDAAAIQENFADERMGNPGAYKWSYRNNEDGSGIRGNGGHSSDLQSGKGWTGGVTKGGRNARSVWTIPTVPYPAAHFATFPEELARRCILAGSSPRTCEHCGAPWERVTETVGVVKRRSGGNDKGGEADNWRRDNNRDTQAIRETVCWQPTCSCENTGTGRSVVLDPFGGSGTVAQVATGNGRDSVYIDLNPAYRELARQRIGPMLCEDAA